ncbi:channel protein TolC [Sulfuricaulis limicola]|uniref:Channel protein TolC n=1 Tax=Sulfuricaulis limicola TaxID=1620215 RepID=A0A1B4XHH6_9GAMM|nr:TolC family outer membrane protein [Sulfuricaulis limicola]BAV34253.1 channel protein TolC [Sulfuricaulis limicola]
MKRLLSLLILLSIGAPAAAADLLDIYHQARMNDPAWRAAQAGRLAGIEKAPQGRALLLPTLGLSAASSESDQQVTTPSAQNNYRYSTDSYNLQLTQPLYRKQNAAAYAQGIAGANIAEHEFELARQDLILRSTLAYFDVLAAQDVLDFSVTEKEAVGRQLALARRNFAVGSATLVDVHEAQARYDLVAAQQITAANDLETRKEALRALIGSAPAALARLESRLELQPPDPADMEQWVQTATAHSPRIKAQQETLEIARQEVERNSGGHYPTLDLTASRNWSDAGGSIQGFAIESTTNQIGLQFQMPLYQGGGISSRVREAAARLEETSQRLDQISREVARRVREAYLAVINGMARVQALEQARLSNERALESTVIGYERGVRNGVDVLNAQRELFRTRRDLSQARYDYLISRLRLKDVAGVLQEPDLEDINRLLAHKQ